MAPAEPGSNVESPDPVREAPAVTKPGLELSIEAAITAKTTARDKCRTAFENGTMDEEDTGPRLRELRTEIEALKVRRDEITDLISDEPVAPSPSTLAKTRARLEDVIANGDSAERKAIIEELIAEIRIIGDEIIPVFRLPRDEPVAMDAATPATSTGDGDEPDPGSRNAKPGGPDVAQPEPHSHCSGTDRDAASRTPTPALTPLTAGQPRSAARLIQSGDGIDAAAQVTDHTRGSWPPRR